MNVTKISAMILPDRRRNLDDSAILNCRNENPACSVSRMSLILNWSKLKFGDTFIRHKQMPFEPKFLHTLGKGNNERGLEYCFWSQDMFHNNRIFLKPKLIYLPMRFHLQPKAVVLSHNSRYYSIVTNNTYQKMYVWRGIRIEWIFKLFLIYSLNVFFDFLNNELCIKKIF